jgi:hypothetical protein
MPTPPVGFVAHVRVTHIFVHKNVYLSDNLCRRPDIFSTSDRLGTGGVKTYKSHDKSPCNMQES